MSEEQEGLMGSNIHIFKVIPLSRFRPSTLLDLLVWKFPSKKNICTCDLTHLTFARGHTSRSGRRPAAWTLSRFFERYRWHFNAPRSESPSGSLSIGVLFKVSHRLRLSRGENKRAVRQEMSEGWVKGRYLTLKRGIVTVADIHLAASLSPSSSRSWASLNSDQCRSAAWGTGDVEGTVKPPRSVKEFGRSYWGSACRHGAQNRRSKPLVPTAPERVARSPREYEWPALAASGSRSPSRPFSHEAPRPRPAGPLDPGAATSLYQSRRSGAHQRCRGRWNETACLLSPDNGPAFEPARPPDPPYKASISPGMVSAVPPPPPSRSRFTDAFVFRWIIPASSAAVIVNQS